MASKGDKGALLPQAERLYAEGHNLSAIAGRLGVSVTSLSKWKAESKRPGETMDEWDRGRSQKRGNIQRLRDLYEDQLAFLESLPARERTAPMMDALSKLGANLERWDKIEKAQQLVATVFPDGTKAKTMTPEELQQEIRKVYGI